jgi:hypothetical protein
MRSCCNSSLPSICKGSDVPAVNLDSANNNVGNRRPAHAVNFSMMLSLQSSFLVLAMALFLVPSSFCFASATWIDPDTPMDVRTTQPFTPRGAVRHKIAKKKNSTHHHHHHHTPSPTGTPNPTFVPTISPTVYPTATPDTFELVFSDEFNTPFRSFEDGNDPRWTALEKNDYTNDALHYYSDRNARTNEDGELVITTEAVDTDIVGYDDVNRKNTHLTKHFRSAMMQSWNKVCFTGGIIEAEVIMPGKHNVGGLWPAFWMLGNLARHTYVGSSEHIWPWSATTCTKKSFDSQLFSGCDSVAHYGMETGVGRGAPEIDIFEVQPGPVKANTGAFKESSVGQPFMSSSFQVAPGRSNQRPGKWCGYRFVPLVKGVYLTFFYYFRHVSGNGFWPGPGQWYEGLVGGNMSALNIQFYGNYNHFKHDPNPERTDYWSDAISYNRQLEEKHFSGKHVYRLEWDVPTESSDGYLHWFLDGELVLAINGTGVKKAGIGTYGVT